MKKTVSLLLAMLLALTLIPLAVFADTGTEAPSSELLASAAAEGKSVVRIVTDPADAVVDLAAGAYYPATRLGDPIEPASNHVFLLEPGYYQAKVTKEGYYTFAKVFYVKEDDLGKAKDVNILLEKTGDYFPPSVLERPDEVIDKFFYDPTPEVKLDTPGFDPAKGPHQFTSHDEMVAFIDGLDDADDNMVVTTIGKTPVNGLDMPLVIFSEGGAATNAEEAKALGKPIVWYQATIHGNEHAPREAALNIIKDLDGEYGEEVLKNVTVVIIPCYNIDGAAVYSRTPLGTVYENGSMKDSNRDNVTFENVETVNVRTAFQAFMPHVAIDGHEDETTQYTDENGKVMLKAYDLMLSCSNGLNIPDSVRNLGYALILDRLQEEVTAAGFRTYDYIQGSPVGASGVYESEANTRKSQHSYAMQATISLLFENFGVDQAKGQFERRVKSQILAVETVINTVADNPDVVKNTVDEARAQLAEKGKTYDENNRLILQRSRKILTRALSYIDLETNEMVGVTCTNYGSEKYAIPTLTRARPTAYIVPKDEGVDYERVRFVLSVAGAEVFDLAPGTTLDVEAYTVESSTVAEKLSEGVHFRQNVVGAYEPKTVTFTNGALLIPMDQVASTHIGTVLEPDGTDSLMMLRVLEPADGDTGLFPVYRYIKDEPRKNLLP